LKEPTSKLPAAAPPINLKQLSPVDLLAAVKAKTTYHKLNVKHNYLNNDNMPPKNRMFDKKNIKVDTYYVGPCSTKDLKGVIVITNVVRTGKDGKMTIDQKAKCVHIESSDKFNFKDHIPECTGSKD
jgi:hypothetical protein